MNSPTATIIPANAATPNPTPSTNPELMLLESCNIPTLRILNALTLPSAASRSNNNPSRNSLVLPTVCVASVATDAIPALDCLVVVVVCCEVAFN